MIYKSHMMGLTDKDYHDILDTVYTVNCCEDKESFLDILMPSLINMFHADCVTFHLLQGAPCHIKIVEARSFKSDKHNLSEDKVYPELYKENFYHQSPLLKDAVSSSKVVLKTGESISLAEWERSDLYNLFILPQHLYWEMFLTLRWKNNLEGMFTLWRSKSQGDYAGRDIQKATVLAPHLMVATHNVSLISRMKKQPVRSHNGEDAGAEGLLLLDHRLKPLYFNAKARQICLQINNPKGTDYDSVANPDFPVPECLLQDCNYLLELLRIERQPIIWPRERIFVTPDNLKFRIESSLIWKADTASSQPNIIVIFNEIGLEPNAGPKLQTEFNLSKRELDIVYYLNKGLSYGEISDQLCISKLTVHTHIKNIYRKLGAKNRIELYRYVQPPKWL